MPIHAGMPRVGGAIPPRFERALRPLNLPAGEDLRMAVQVAAEPAPTFYWFYNETPLVTTHVTGYDVDIFTRVNQSQLRIQRPRDGHYHVVAVNEAGSARSDARVQIIGMFFYKNL